MTASDERSGRPSTSGDRGARGPYRNGLRTREQIIATAMTSFSQRGYHGSSTRQIAAAVGISPAAILRHFGSKDELLAAVIESWADQTAEVQSADERLTGLRRWLAQHEVMAYHTEHRGLLQLFVMLASESTDADHPARAYMAARYHTIVESFAADLVRAARDGDIDPITEPDALREARAMFAYMDGIELQWLLDPGIDMVGEFDAYLAQTLARLGWAGPPAG